MYKIFVVLVLFFFLLKIFSLSLSTWLKLVFFKEKQMISLCGRYVCGLNKILFWYAALSSKLCDIHPILHPILRKSITIKKWRSYFGPYKQSFNLDCADTFTHALNPEEISMLSDKLTGYTRYVKNSGYGAWSYRLD